MNISFDRKNIIIALFSFAFLLLILNALISQIIKPSANKIESKEISSEEINNKFLTCVKVFGIREEWIQVQKLNKNANDSIKYYYNISVPKDLSIALVLNEIINSFGKGETDYSSKETSIKGSKKKGITLFILKSGGFDKLKAEFVYNPDSKRASNSVGFLVFGFNSPDTVKQYELINSPENYLAVLIPSKDALEKIKRLKARDKDYAVMLTDEITDLDYKFNSKYSIDRLKISLRSLLGDFPGTAAFLYDSKSDFASTPIFQWIKREIEKRKIKFLDINRFNMIEEGGTSLNDSIEHLLNQADENKTEIIFVSEENYAKLNPEIIKYRKVGYKFINPFNALTGFN